MDIRYFNFEPLISKYSSEFNVISSNEGYYDESGDYVESEPTKKTMTGAILSLKEDKIYRSEGQLTSEDRQLFMTTALPDGFIGSIIVFNGNKYKVQQMIENAEFTGVWEYLLKYISAFNE